MDANIEQSQISGEQNGELRGSNSSENSSEKISRGRNKRSRVAASPFFDAPLPALHPIPAPFVEPLERLIDALKPGGMTLLVRGAAHVEGDWLTAERLLRHLRECLMEPVDTQVWHLLPDIWAISLRVRGGNVPVDTIHIHTLQRTLSRRLNEEWNKGSLPAFCPPPEDAPEGAPITFEADILDTPSAFTLLPLSAMYAVDTMQGNIAELNSLLDIIVNKQMRAQFQPIVSLSDGQVLGYEALIRAPRGALLRRPGQMFRAADKARMVSWFDLACLEQCFLTANQQELRHLLFVNMDAEGLACLDLHDRPLAVRAREAGLDPANIVIEITERQTIGDFPRLMSDIASLREQGFKIAVDDAGTGYSSLHAIAELRPEFVKLDRSMVRNLDVCGERRALLTALVGYARQIGTAILGEGVETREELATLIDLGVTYGQGYLMGKPVDNFRGVPRETREFIQRRAQQRLLIATGRTVTVGAMARKGLTMAPDAPLESAVRAFSKNPSLTSVVVVEEGRVQGLLMRQSLDYALKAAVGARATELMPEQTAAQWMSTNMLFAEESLSVCEMARQATTRADLSLDSDIVVVRGGTEYVGVVPVRVLIEATAATQVNRLQYADPLTNLPNRVVLEQTLQERITARLAIGVVRIDICGLESYNRRYGLAHGDAVIQALARLLQQISGVSGTPEDLIAHLGGDDFVVLTGADQVQGYCRMLTERFAALAPQFFSAEHLRSGMMDIAERSGGTRQVPLFTLSVKHMSSIRHKLSYCAQVLQDLNTMGQSSHTTKAA